MRNLYSGSEAMINAPWLVNSANRTSGQAGAFGGTSALKIVPQNAVDVFAANGNGGINQSVTLAAATLTTLLSFYVKSAGSNQVLVRESTSTGRYVQFDLTTLAVTYSSGASAANFLSTITPVAGASGWFRCAVLYANSNVNNLYTIKSGGPGNATIGDGVNGIVVDRPMLEDVTGQSVQTPSEYVSTGVLSAPYQGTGVDGVQCFDTVRLHTQNAITQSVDPTNVAWSRSNASTPALVVDSQGGTTAVKLTDNGVNSQHAWFQNSSITTYVGQAVAFDIDVKRGDYRYLEIDILKSDFSGSVSATIDFNSPLSAPVVAVGGTSYFSSLGGAVADIGNGWYRLTVQGVATVSMVLMAAVYLKNDANSNSFAGTGTSGTFIGRPNLRGAAPSFLSTYVPTTAAAIGPTDTGLTAPIPSTTLLGYLAEESRTNQVVNNTMAGAVAGVIGSGGALPTNWSFQNDFNNAAFTKTIALGYENGMPYIDIRIQGTLNGAVGYGSIQTSGGDFAASNGQKYNLSAYAKMVAGATTNLSNFGLWASSLDASHAFIANYSVAWPVASAGSLLSNRVAGDVTIVNATTAFFSPVRFFANYTNNTPIDITLRLAMPQTELATNSGATSPIPTSSGAVTRNADVLTYGSVTWDKTQGSAYMEFSTLNAVRLNGQIASAVDGVSTYFGVIGGGGSFTAYDGTTFAGAGAAVAANTTYKCAVGWGPGSGAGKFSLIRSGDVLTTYAFDGDMGATGSATLNVGNFGGGVQLNGCISNLRLYGTRFPNAQLTERVS